MSDLTLQQIHDFVNKVGGREVVIRFLNGGDADAFKEERFKTLQEALDQKQEEFLALKEDCHKCSKELWQWLNKQESKSLIAKAWHVLFVEEDMNYLKRLAEHLLHR